MPQEHDSQFRHTDNIRIFGSLTNISLSYFKTLVFILRHPLRFSSSFPHEQHLPAWLFFVSGCGLVFITWFISGLVRQGAYPAFELEVFSLVTGIASANIYALFVGLTGSLGPPYRLLRDSYFYTFGAVSTWILIIIEIGNLLLVRHVIGRVTPECPARNMSCLLSLTTNTKTAETFAEVTQATLGLLGITFLLLIFKNATNARVWRALVALLGVLIINGLFNEFATGPVIDWLKERGLMG